MHAFAMQGICTRVHGVLQCELAASMHAKFEHFYSARHCHSSTLHVLVTWYITVGVLILCPHMWFLHLCG